PSITSTVTAASITVSVAPNASPASVTRRRSDRRSAFGIVIHPVAAAAHGMDQWPRERAIDELAQRVDLRLQCRGRQLPVVADECGGIAMVDDGRRPSHQQLEQAAERRR